MPRFIPPHLMAPVALLIVVVWFMLVHHFRRSFAVQRYIAETIGDDTPENALLAFELAKSRLTQHLKNGDLAPELRQQIELALTRTTQENI